MSRRLVMRMMVTLTLLSGAWARPSFAQTSAVHIRAARVDTITLDSSRASTAVFTLRNDGSDVARVHPHLTAPANWTTLSDSGAVRVAPRGMETWLASVSAPANASAGMYVVRATLAENTGATDSIVIRVAEVRAAELLPIDVPGWVVSGGEYQAKFIVRNRGNVVSTLALSGTTSRGRRCTVDVPSVTLAPGASTTITLRVIGMPATPRATDDVVELVATDTRDAGMRVTSSARTTVVPSGGTVADRATIPGEFAVRAMSTTAGVSPVTFTSSGVLSDRKTSIDLAFHAKPAIQTAFGEREEYHLAIHRDALSVRLGDGLYGFSPLTSPTSLGLGGSVESTMHGVGTGMYVERSRWGTGQPVEAGAYIGAPRDAATGITATIVGREYASGLLAEVGGVGARFAVPAIGGNVSLETAGSRDSANAIGIAERVRISGTRNAFSYDVGHALGAPTFEGPQRGLEQDDALLNLQVAHNVTLSSSGMMSITTPSVLNLAAGQRFTTLTTGANYAGKFTLDYVRTSRYDLAPAGMRGTQQGARILTSLPLRAFQLSTTLDGGIANEASSGVHRPFVTVNASTRWNFAAGRGVTLFGDYNDGHALGADGRSVVSAGASADARLLNAIDFSMLGTASTIAASAPPAGGVMVSQMSFGQVDARFTYRLPSGASLSLRAHLWSNAKMQGSTAKQLMYFEYRAPLRLPVGRTQAGHRVEGRVVEAGTGKPVVGTLVRVGGQAAVTDKNGRVILAGLEPGKYLVSVETKTAGSRPLVEQTPSVEVFADAKRPASFEVRLAEAGRLRVAVRKLGYAGSLSSSADSLVDEGAQANVLVALQGARDTLYQTSDEHGRLDFGEVPVGTWTLAVRSDNASADDQPSANPVRVIVAAGAVRSVDLNLVPRRRAITFVGGGELTAAPDAQKNQRSRKN